MVTWLVDPSEHSGKRDHSGAGDRPAGPLHWCHLANEQWPKKSCETDYIGFLNSKQTHMFCFHFVIWKGQ